MKFTVNSIGEIRDENGPYIALDPKYAPGLLGLEGFGHVVIVWVPNQLPPWSDDYLETPGPYTKGPARLGVFAGRGPMRPNPLCISVNRVTGIDAKNGTIRIEWTDAAPGSPVLDIKPYHPSEDRVREISVPAWCSHWPQWYEDSGEFGWEEEFNF
ncbi:TrmO family methyltransferase domain-containing protein [Breznakiella homolactica]|uniref:SAM-dependent methyltransferase n=1 Tax=Breznakiella homolactica TaxID=2798577 RepID=A0A7T8BA18_9SPIR|nr:TrmO family methyltransferase [Breznakiella homolactica]QQO09077.1 TrmO family methyltransferase [Breznakiella homolactica]